MKRSLLLLIFFASAQSAIALTDLQVGQAQAQMHQRINSKVNAYAERIGVPADLITYCQSQMFLDTRHTTDGSIPFGVNYRNISSQDELDTVISVREAYEQNYLMLCLATSKAKLAAAESN